MAEKLYIHDFTVEQIINEVPIYQKLYINLPFDNIYDSYEDINTYNELFKNDKRIISECVTCGRRLPFSTYTEKPLFPMDAYRDEVRQMLHNYENSPVNDYPGLFDIDNVKSKYIQGEIQKNDKQITIIDNIQKSFEYFTVSYECTYCKTNSMFISYKLTEEIIDFMFSEFYLMKIGQYPPTWMLNQNSTRSYRKELNENDYKELSKALELHSNGFSVASFVYLRRIYENLIQQEHEKQRATIKDWNEPKYQKSNFGDQVKILVDNGADIIPSEIDNHKANIYRILSLGVHQYTEEECTQYFDLIFTCITLILQHSIDVKTKAANIHNLNAALNKIP